MAYITQKMLEDRSSADMVAKFLKQTAGTVDYEAAVADIIERSDDRVNSFLSIRFTIPVTVTGMIEEFSLAIAEWELYRRGSGGVPEKIRQAYEDALKDLRDIAKGLMDIGGTTLPTPSTSTSGMELASATGIFDAQSMEDAAW